MIRQLSTTTPQEGVGGVPGAVHRQRLHQARVPGGQPHGDFRAEGQAEHVGPFHLGGLHEGGDVVGEQFGGIGALGLTAQPGPAQVHGEARELLGVVRYLERVTGLVGRQVRNEDHGLALALDLVVDVDAVRLYGWHGILPFA
jgi:hypothetical protein